MDREAARRARRQTFKANLSDAYTDEEANPPEWLDLQSAIALAKRDLRERIDSEVTAFVNEPDIRRALARRERATDDLTRRIDSINRMVRRLNLVAPLQRFTQPGLDPDELLRPLYRSMRQSSG